MGELYQCQFPSWDIVVLLCRRRQWHPTPVLLPRKSHGRRSLVGCSPWGRYSRTWLSNFTFTFHFHALEKEMATHSSVIAWRIPGMGEPGGLLSVGSHRVRHDWGDLVAAAAAVLLCRMLPLEKLGGVHWHLCTISYNFVYIYNYLIFLFFSKMFFEVGHFEVFVEFVTILLLLFLHWCFANRHVGS